MAGGGIKEEEVSKLKTRFRLIAAAALAVPLCLIGTTAASASTTYNLCPQVNTTLCVWTGEHNMPAALTNFRTDAQISFINEYTSPNGNRWYELEITQNGECLNWLPNGYVYLDSCVPLDANELWYNHVAGQLINLAGNEVTGHDTYLQPFEAGCLVNGAHEACPIIATNTFYGGWEEIPA